MMDSLCELELSRRNLLVGAAASAATIAMLSRGAKAQAPQAGGLPPAPSSVKFTLHVNGTAREVELDTRTTLLDALREHLHLTSTKKGCDHGQCGACTVIAGGRRINACLTLVVMQEGEPITTIEGLGTPERLHPLQAAFVKQEGYQCGCCPPGQICSAVGAIGEIKAGIPRHVTADLTVPPSFTSAELRECMSGNICRCGAYSNIVEAITEVAESKS